MKRTRPHHPIEFGDFQTPRSLADDVCRFLSRRGIVPATVVEPTCGLGTFLMVAFEQFRSAVCLGSEINPEYVRRLAPFFADQQTDRGCEKKGIGSEPTYVSQAKSAPGEVPVPLFSQRHRGRVLCENFFEIDWRSRFRDLSGPVLVLGNPPWVTSAQIGSSGGSNLPEKSNFQGHAGLDALTGKSNFDISEWMLIRLLEALAGQRGWLAMLVKTAVARKVLTHTWKNGIALVWAEMRAIDAATHFGAAVEACLFVSELAPEGTNANCAIFPDLIADAPTSVIGYRDGQIIADVRAYDRWKHLAGASPYQWRSGVKHDCAKVMELRKEPGGFRNGFGELVELEDDFLYPMLKSSEVAKGQVDEPTRWMLVPQKSVGEDTTAIRSIAPRTWQYLERHGTALDRRGSSIYRKRPRFSVFGVGPYSFAPWKVAISGFYKRLEFTVVGPFDGKPVVFDDTVYFRSCSSEAEARLIASLLNSTPAREFFSSLVFWDAKRPITVDLLRRLDLRAVAREVGDLAEFDRLLGDGAGYCPLPLRASADASAAGRGGI